MPKGNPRKDRRTHQKAIGPTLADKYIEEAHLEENALDHTPVQMYLMQTVLRAHSPRHRQHQKATFDLVERMIHYSVDVWAREVKIDGWLRTQIHEGVREYFGFLQLPDSSAKGEE